jgi:predicted transglutaminase-like cysteine proteinase
VLSRPARRACAALVVVLCLTLAHHAPAAPRLFDAAVPALAADIALPRWERARTALVRDGRRLDACLTDAAACDGPRRTAWRELVLALRAAARPAQLDAVNRFVNGVPYARDRERYGVRDFWAGPWGFLAGAGDCEDYAIAKYATLARLGVPVRDMRILVVEDVRRGLAHAVLAVRTAAGVRLLDNQSDRLIDAALDRRYAPYYAVNEHERWLYRLPERAAAAR